MRGTSRSLGAGPATDLRVFATILCRIRTNSRRRPAPAPRAGSVRRVRVLVVTNMYPTRERPGSARSCATRSRRCGAATTSRSSCSRSGPGRARWRGAARALRARYRGRRFDIVHAHFGLTAWPALLARLGPVVVTLHGNDLLVRRSYLATRAALPFTALAAAVSREFSANLPGARDDAARRGAAGRHRPAALPARSRGPRRARGSGSTPTGPYLLFPHDPSRPLKRYDRAVEAAGDVPLLTLGGVAPDEVPYWINAANAVLVPSAEEGFGLSVIEALACGVPAFGTPVGIHPVALHGIEGAYCARVGSRRLARRARGRTWRRPTRASTAAPARSCSRPTRWPRASSRRGAICSPTSRRPIRGPTSWRSIR